MIWCVLFFALSFGLAAGLAIALRQRRRFAEPDLCDRYRKAWAMSNDEIRGIGA